MSKIKVGLCAFGMSGRVFHGPLLEAHPDFHFTHVWQRTASDARDFYPAVQIVRSLEALLSLPELSLIVVNTPEVTHFEFAKAALLAGKHVVVEKAFTPTVAEAVELENLAQEKGLVLAVFQNRRWDGNFLTVKDIIESGKIGRLVQYEAHYHRFRPEVKKGSWKEEKRKGTGVLYNLGSHLIDQALHLFGMPERIWADIDQQRTEAQVPDYFALYLFYPRLKVKLNASYLVRKPVPKYVLYGEKGSYHHQGDDPQEAAMNDGLLPHTPAWDALPQAHEGQLFLDAKPHRVPGKKGRYLSFYDQVSAAIQAGSPAYVQAKEGKQVIQLIEAAYESAQSGQVVSL
ncbi:MAG: Gfo/Idh/MocA family oxidoreductase [Bacteroidota bacterium]